MSELRNTADSLYTPALENLKFPWAVTEIRVEVPVIVKPFERPTLNGKVGP